MIFGIGIDLIEVERVAEKIAKNNGFTELVFSKNEIEYCEAMKNKYEHYAVRFAAEEAFFKAIGTGWQNGSAFNEIEISKNKVPPCGVAIKNSPCLMLNFFDISGYLFNSPLSYPIRLKFELMQSETSPVSFKLLECLILIASPGFM